ncbi:MAG: hypothetical protein WBP93_05030, partial [Pyrinomonadaceae bacterium]
LKTQQFVLQKSKTERSECEDAVGVNTEALRYAIADGATEAFDAGRWAERLASEWVKTQGALTIEDFGAWLAEQGSWLHASWDGRTLSWFAEEKARVGSFAAFVGVEFDLSVDAPRWKAIALGDSCLIHLRGGVVCSAFPLSDHQSFNSAPVLVPSLSSFQETALKQAVADSGTLEQGDVVLLLSDAAAAWYLKLSLERDAALKDLDALLKASATDALEKLFEEERRAGRIKDDDVAILRIAVEYL